MRILLLIVAAIAGLIGASSEAAAQVVLTESFDTVADGPGGPQGNYPTGWFAQNNSAAIGGIGYFQGSTNEFLPFSGTGYIGANYNSAAQSGSPTISNWLISPIISNISNGMVFSFYSRTAANPSQFPDRLEIRLNTNNTTTNVGAIGDAAAVGDFTNLLFTINPTLTSTGYPNVWTQFNVVVSGVAAPVSGRFAFRYFMPDAGINGNNSDYIGIDDLVVTAAVPEPTSLALLGFSALGLVWKRRRSQKPAA